MASLIDYILGFVIWTIILWALDKYKKYRIDNWKKSFIASAIYWLIIGFPYIYFTLRPPILFLIILTFIGIPLTAVVIRIIAWIVYPFLDELKKKK